MTIMNDIFVSIYAMINLQSLFEFCCFIGVVHLYWYVFRAIDLFIKSL